jgi:TetR/AcrR family transcriptional regulator, mexJK operon transcriptional repressor
MASHGFDFSMEDVARLAGVARQTVYNIYPSKAALASATMEQLMALLTQALEPDNSGQDIATTLSHFADSYLTNILTPNRIMIMRALAAPASIAKGYGAMFYKLGPLALRERLAAYLAGERDKGHIHLESPVLAADLFFAMVAGTLQIRGMLGIAEPPELADRAARVRLAVHMFLQGLRGPPESV